MILSPCHFVIVKSLKKKSLRRQVKPNMALFAFTKIFNEDNCLEGKSKLDIWNIDYISNKIHQYSPASQKSGEFSISTNQINLQNNNQPPWSIYWRSTALCHGCHKQVCGFLNFVVERRNYDQLYQRIRAVVCLCFPQDLCNVSLSSWNVWWRSQKQFCSPSTADKKPTFQPERRFRWSASNFCGRFTLILLKFIFA